jgi:hypothetical protein
MAEAELGRDALLSTAQVLVELGEVVEAEGLVADLLHARPDDLDALSLLAKVKHIKGELSQTIACWAQVQALAPPPADAAALQLQSIFQLATDPERWASEFVALGQLQRVRRPAAYLAIEEAFADFSARKLETARLKLLQAAERYKQDPEAYRLIILASAWICEVSGRVEDAITILEKLGTERGFEVDADRVLMLARLYERDGSKERLEAALHIWRYFEQRTRRLEVSCRLGAINRRLGDVERARGWELIYRDALRQRMHRPTLPQVLEVASRRYLPLMQLRGLSFESRAYPGEPERVRALGLALEPRLEKARAAFIELGTVLDEKYLADLLVLEGHEAGAEAAYLALLQKDPSDLRIIGWLLEHRPAGVSRAMRDTLRSLADPVREALELASRAAPLRPELWRHRAALARIEGLGDEAARRLEERARALEGARRRDAHAVGRVLSAAIYRFVGRTKGLIHEVWAERELAPLGRGGTLPEDRIYGNLSPQMRQAMRSTFFAVREYARSKFPHQTQNLQDFTYSFKVTKDDEPSWGLSVGLPAAVAFLSVFLQRPVSQNLAMSGVLVADSHDVLTVHPVGDTEYKVKAAYHRNLELLVLPMANQRELLANARIPPELHESLVRYVRDLDGAMTLVFGEDIFESDTRGPAMTA